MNGITFVIFKVLDVKRTIVDFRRFVRTPKTISVFFWRVQGGVQFLNDANFEWHQNCRP